jgi:hypothetical protein
MPSIQIYSKLPKVLSKRIENSVGKILEEIDYFIMAKYCISMFHSLIPTDRESRNLLMSLKLVCNNSDGLDILTHCSEQ